MKKILLVFLIPALLAAAVLSGCAQQPTSQSPAIDANFKALQGSFKKLQGQIEGLELKVGVYKSIADCKEKAMATFIDGNTIVQKTSLKDALERCDAVFSTMKALAERS